MVQQNVQRPRCSRERAKERERERERELGDSTQHGLEHVRPEHLIGLPAPLLVSRTILVRTKLSQVVIVSLRKGSGCHGCRRV